MIHDLHHPAAGWSLRASGRDDGPAVWSFLEPFVADQQILPRTAEQISSLFQSGFLAEASGRLIGCAAVEVYSAKMAEIQCLAVDAAFRRQGVGRQLVAACVERAKQRGVRELMAITASDGLFLACGFDYALPGQKRALFIQTNDNP
jgi:amino-acid N-acetyltransferase